LLIIAPTYFGLNCLAIFRELAICLPHELTHKLRTSKTISSFSSYYFTSACLKSWPGSCLSRGWLCFPSVPPHKIPLKHLKSE